LPAADTAIRQGTHAGRFERLSIVLPIFRFGRPGTAAEISARLAQPGAFRIAEETASPGMALAG